MEIKTNTSYGFMIKLNNLILINQTIDVTSKVTAENRISYSN